MNSFLEYYRERDSKARKFNGAQKALFDAFTHYHISFDAGDLNKDEFRDIVGLFDSLWDFSDIGE